MRGDHSARSACVNKEFDFRAKIPFWTVHNRFLRWGLMLRRLYDWVMEIAAHRNASIVLGTVSFVESSFFPIPPDAFLIPMVLANREKAWWYAFVCTVTSVIGGLLGYAIGALLFDTIGQRILEIYSLQAHFEEFSTNYTKNGWLYVFAAGLTPFPYKVITIASGAIGLSLPVFIGASIVSRSLRFFLVAGLLYYFGPPVKSFIEKYLGWLTILFVLLLAGGFYLVRYM